MSCMVFSNDRVANADDIDVTIPAGLYQFVSPYEGSTFTIANSRLSSDGYSKFYYPYSSSRDTLTIQRTQQSGSSSFSNFSWTYYYFSQSPYYNILYLNYSSNHSFYYTSRNYSIARDYCSIFFTEDTLIPLEFFNYLNATTVKVEAEYDGLQVFDAANLVYLPDTFTATQMEVFWFDNNGLLGKTSTNVYPYTNSSMYAYAYDLSNGKAYYYEIIGGQLATPVVSQTNNTLSWNTVKHATAYQVSDLTNSKEIVTTSDTFVELSEMYDDCYISVRAISSDTRYEYSLWSTPLLFTFQPSPDVPTVKLGTPTLVSYSNLLNWDSIGSADYYEIYRDDVLISQTLSTAYSVSISGNYKVRACSDNPFFVNSDFSNVVQFDRSVITLTVPYLKYNRIDSTLYWDSIGEGITYTIYRNNVIIADTNYLFFTPTMSGTYSITATLGSDTSYFSNQVIVSSTYEDEIYKKGYDYGYKIGKDKGFQEGYEKGASGKEWLGFFSGILSAPVVVLLDLLSFEIFGFNMTVFFRTLLTFVVIIAIVRFFLGLRGK